MAVDFFSLKLNDRQFDKISKMVYQVSGIDLHQGKEELVKARLLKRLRALQIPNFDRYLKYIEKDSKGTEIQEMVDVLTTNKTHFFREMEHLNFLKDKIMPNLKKDRIRIWSAGCSSGEEPYSIAIVLREMFPDIGSRDVKILATDISDRMLEKARYGTYDEELVKSFPPQYRSGSFVAAERVRPRKYAIAPAVKSLVYFAKLNLMEQWPMSGPFDVIFCRNVMIYFDKPTQESLVKRFWDVLADGGYLLVGHSESLTFLSHNYRYIQPAVYKKINNVPVKAHSETSKKQDG
jgi:chemotaxis protein methyltransferase CheR